MDERRPKRRKDKDNPYTLNCWDGRYYITFKDEQSVDQCIEISEELFQVFDRFELDDLRQSARTPFCHFFIAGSAEKAARTSLFCRDDV